MERDTRRGGAEFVALPPPRSLPAAATRPHGGPREREFRPHRGPTRCTPQWVSSASGNPPGSSFPQRDARLDGHERVGACASEASMDNACVSSAGAAGSVAWLKSLARGIFSVENRIVSFSPNGGHSLFPNSAGHDRTFAVDSCLSDRLTDDDRRRDVVSPEAKRTPGRATDLIFVSQSSGCGVAKRFRRSRRNIVPKDSPECVGGGFCSSMGAAQKVSARLGDNDGRWRRGHWRLRQ